MANFSDGINSPPEHGEDRLTTLPVLSNTERFAAEKAFFVYFEELFEEPKPIFVHPNDALREIVQLASLENGSVDAWDVLGNPTPYTQALLKLFLDSLEHFLKNKRTQQDPENVKKLEKFLITVNERYFSGSTNLVSFLPFFDHIFVKARHRRDIFLEKYVNVADYHEILEKLDFFSEYSIQNFVQQLFHIPVPHVLDVIHYLTGVALHVHFSEGWAQNVTPNIERILTGIDETFATPFIHYAVQVAQNAIKSAVPRNAIDRKKIANNHTQLAHRFLPSGTVNPGWQLHQVASDAVAAFDSNNFPRSLANLKEGLPSNPAALNFFALKYEIDNLSQSRRRYRRNEEVEILWYVHENFLKPLHGENAYQEWENLFPEISALEWKTQLDAVHQELIAADRNSLRQAVVEGLQSDVEEEVDRIVNELIEPPNRGTFKKAQARSISLPFTVLNIAENKEKLVAKLQRIFDENKESVPHLQFQEYQLLAANPHFNPFQANGEELVLLMQDLHSPAMMECVEEDLGIKFSEIPLRSQIHLLRFLQDKDRSTFDRLKKALAHGGANRTHILNSFLACAGDVEFGSDILNLAEIPESDPIFQAYAEFTQNAATLASHVVEVSYGMDYEEVYRRLLERGKHLLEEAKKALSTPDTQTKQRTIQHLVKDLETENAHQSAMRAFALSISEALKGKNVDVRAYEKWQAEMVNLFDEYQLGTVLLKGLQARGALAPVPEIHWRVDRTAEEYRRRFGFDVQKFLAAFAQDGKKQLLLEFGPGNGTFKQERAAVGGYTDLALCDKVYYPLNTLIKKIIDFEKLEYQSGKLSDEEKNILCDFLYKILVIREGGTAADAVEYDTSVMEAIQNDPHNVVEHLLAKAHLLSETKVVPQTISTRDENGNVIYPYKIEKPNTEAFTKACALLGANMKNYLIASPENLDIYQHIPAYSPGTMVGEFSDIANVRDGQIDVALGARSVVYYRDQKYVDFMNTITSKLSPKGIYVDDSIRDNDGWYYRLAELREAQNDNKTPLYVVVGKGFEGEDFNQKDLVPLAVISTKDQAKLQYIKANLNLGFQLKKLDELLTDEKYLQSLDSTGLVLSKVNNQTQEEAA